MAKTIEKMCKEGVFEVFENDEVGLTQKQRDLGRRDFDIYLFLIWPFIEGYWLAACSLLLLAVPSKIGKAGPGNVQWFAAKEFEKRAQVSRAGAGCGCIDAHHLSATSCLARPCTLRAS